MYITNKKTANKIKFTNRLYVFIYAVIMVSSLYFAILPYYIVEIISTLLVGAVLVYRLMRDYYFVILNIESNSITVKYSSLGPMSNGNNAFEIKSKDFVKYELDKPGLKRYIKLYGKFQGKLGAYPKISVTAFTNDQINDIVKGLNKLK